MHHLSDCPEGPAGTGRTLSVPPVTRGSRGKVFFFYCHSTDVLPYFLTFGLLSCLVYFVETTGRGYFGIARPPRAKSTTPDRQPNRITSAPTAVNRAVCAGTQVYSNPAKSQYGKPCLSAVRLPCSLAVARFVRSTVDTVSTVRRFPPIPLLFLIVCIPTPRKERHN